ncbi:hypothetical protein HZ326_10679 [Fusarium oxysporum f. sp. albedinis]|nr:hypothetical protein HZ326_10679 [Fusarium oxysporum f. sp. albedinis]
MIQAITPAFHTDKVGATAAKAVNKSCYIIRLHGYMHSWQCVGHQTRTIQCASLPITWDPNSLFCLPPEWSSKLNPLKNGILGHFEGEVADLHVFGIILAGINGFPFRWWICRYGNLLDACRAAECQANKRLFYWKLFSHYPCVRAVVDLTAQYKSYLFGGQPPSFKE